MHLMIQWNFAPIAISIFLILFILSNSNFEPRINRLFLYALTSVIGLVVVESLEYEASLLTYPTALRVVASAFGYTFRCTVAYLIALISYRDINFKKGLIFSIPLFINVVVVFSALFSNVAFSYSMENQFIRGPLGITPYIVSIFYVLALIVNTYTKITKGLRMEAIITIGIALFSIIGTVFDGFLGYHSILSTCCAMSIAFYYLFFHTEVSSRDELTQAFVRKRMFIDAQKHENILTSVITLDVNNLKEYNDQFGHVAGDKVLVSVVKTTMKCIPNNCRMYRVGGDEFTILCFRMDEKSTKQLVETIKAELEKTSYRAAIGYSMYTGNKTLEHVCNEADELMYQDKEEMKDEAVTIS